MKNHRKKRIVAGVMAGAMAFTMASCQIEGQEPTNVNTTSISSTETTTNPDLKDVAPERLEFTKDLLNLYDVSSKQHISGDFEGSFDKIKDFISRDQIIEYGKNGETGENLSIVNHKDGSPAVALINCPDNVINSFDEMVEEISQYDSLFLEKATENGLVAFMINEFVDDTGNGFTFNGNGLVVYNAKSEMVSLTNYKVLEGALITEIFGNKCFSLGGDYARYAGFIKQQLASDCLLKLYEESSKEYFESFAESNYFIGKKYYGEYYSPVKLEDEEIRKLIKDIRDNNLIKPIGADSWSEIKSSKFTE